MITLHSYVLRELLKTFVLTIVALTALFTMGGGLYNVMSYEGVTTADLLRVLPLLIPIVVTLTMPVSALFAATMVYGRLAADNELVACRAAGINVHRLFLSVILLSIFVTLFTMFSANFVIPDFMKRLHHLARTNLRDIALQKLRQEGNIHYGDEHFMTAEAVGTVSQDELRRKSFPTGAGLDYLWITAPTFLQLDRDGEVVRFAAAEGGLCQFDTRQQDVKITVFVSAARDFEIGRRTVYFRDQKLGPISVPLRLKVKPSMVDLKTLLRWHSRPWDSDKMRPRIADFFVPLRHHRFYVDCAQRLNAGETLRLFDEAGARYELRAEQCLLGGRRPALTNLRVEVHDPQTSLPTIYQAARGELIARAAGDGHSLVEVRLIQTAEQPVLTQYPRADDYHAPRENPTVHLDGLLIPQHIVNQTEAFTPALVVDRAKPMPLPPELHDARVRLQRSSDKLRRKVAALIHFRLGYAGSALVTILMGAALGVVFRGSRALAAFGLACIPFGTVTILLLMGRQLGERAGTQLVGALIIWGGLGLVALADGLILRLGVRR